MILGNREQWSSTGNAAGSTFTSTAGDLAKYGITDRPHVFAGVRFTDNDGVSATPGAGTYTFTAETIELPGVFQPVVGGTTVDATAAAVTLSIGANITRIKVAPTGITTATKFDVILSANLF